jgi:cytochrome P450
MAIVAKTMFDADVLDNPDNVAEALTTFADLMSKNAFGGMQLPDWVPTEANREKKRALTLVDGIVADIVARRRTEGRDRGDLLSMLILTQDEDNNTLTDQQILDQTKSLFFAGHETTAKALTWTFYLLAQNPEAESRLHAEVDEVLGAGPNGRRAGADDFAKLVYTQRVIREAMRLYPPAWILDREPQTDVVIGGHTFKKGSKIFFSPYLTHRDARWWPDPERFDPDRFTPEQEASRHKHAYVPFGGGPRVCIGQIFAMMEATLATATIAQRVRLALAPGQVIEPAASSTLYPKNGLKLIPSAR